MSLPPEATGPRSHPRKGRWTIVALLWVAYFLNQADRQIFGVTLPRIQADFGLSDVQMGLVATTFTVAFGLLVPFAGAAGDRFDRRIVVAFSLLLFSAGTLLTAFAHSFVLLLLLRGVATGAGEAFYQPAASSLIAERHVATRARALSVHQSANYVGVVFGSLFAGWIADAYGWRHAFGAFGAAGLLWAAIFVWATRGTTEGRDAPRPATGTSRARIAEAARLILRDPILLAQIVGFSALVFVLVGYLTWMPTILFERFHMSLADAAFSAVSYHHALAALGLVLGSWLTDRLVHRWRLVRLVLMTGSLIVCGGLLWAVGDAMNLNVALALLALFGLFRGIYDANLFAAIFDRVEDRLRSTATGLIVAVAYLVGALSPVAMGWLKQHVGIASSLHLLGVIAGCAGLGCALLVTISRADATAGAGSSGRR